MGIRDLPTLLSSSQVAPGLLQILAPWERGNLDTSVFTESVSNVSIYWQYSYGLYMNFFSDDFGELGSFTEPVCATYPVSLCSGVVSFADPGAFEMTWTTNQSGYSVSGVGGIDSLSYTAIPEPSAGFLLLTGVGLLGLVMARKRVARGHIATTRMHRARTQVSRV